MKLSPHFTLEEMITSEYAARNGIDNYPPQPIIDVLRTTAEHLEIVRMALGGPIHITSGFRSPTLNAAIGGSPTSAHLRGYAADFICPSFGTPFSVAYELSTRSLSFDQLIHEFGTWTHISFEPRMRRQLLTIKRDGQGYQPGILP